MLSWKISVEWNIFDFGISTGLLAGPCLGPFGSFG
jgi:hypothetical protein